MRIGIDFDETLADSIGYLLPLLNEELGTNYNPEIIDRWEYHKALGLEKDFFWSFYHVKMEKAEKTDILPQRYTNIVIPLLASKHELYILTARQHKFREQLTSWNDYWFPSCFEEVLTCGGQENGVSKSRMMTDYGLDLLVDDSYKDVVEVRNIPRAAILYTANHNKEQNYPFRADNWYDVMRILS